MITPNWFAYVALLAWPLVAIVLYRNLSLSKATIWTIVGGYLLLPVGAAIKIEMIPPFDKSSIPSLAALVCCATFSRRLIKPWNGFGVPELLILLLIVSRFITSILNNDALVFGSSVLPALDAYDGMSAAFAGIIALIPFILGRNILRNDFDIKALIYILSLAGVVYSIPILFEVRMSPQLHIWIYGYYPHDMFGQSFREGGFRPVVFLGHGLLVAFLIATSLGAATALWRIRYKIYYFSAFGVTLYLAAIVILCKTLSALIYGLFLVATIRFLSPRMQALIAILLVATALTYPMMRNLDLVPTKLLVEVAGSVNEDRASSFETRFDWEGKLLQRASERLWFGWGRFGRSRIFTESGRDVTLSDGYWVIAIGQFGFVGFLAEFGLLFYAVLRLATVLKLEQGFEAKLLLATLSLILAINVIDLLPNASLKPWTWLLAGAALGRSEFLARRQKRFANRNVSVSRANLGDRKRALVGRTDNMTGRSLI
jgi:hypothetical protein